MLSIITKLGQSVREAVLGRMEPSQLAWGVAFGVLLGIVPHSNLLAIVLIAVVISLRLNHGVAAVLPSFQPCSRRCWTPYLIKWANGR